MLEYTMYRYAGDINLDQGGTLLVEAVKHGRMLTIAALGARGDCDPNAITCITSFKGAAVHVAASFMCRSYQTLRALLTAFPSLDVNLRCPLQFASHEHHAVYVFEDLPLHLAVATPGEDSAEKVKLLLKAGANPTAVCNSGKNIHKTAVQTARLWHSSDSQECLKQTNELWIWQASLRASWISACVALIDVGYKRKKNEKNMRRHCAVANANLQL